MSVNLRGLSAPAGPQFQLRPENVTTAQHQCLPRAPTSARKLRGRDGPHRTLADPRSLAKQRPKARLGADFPRPGKRLDKWSGGKCSHKFEPSEKKAEQGSRDGPKTVQECLLPDICPTAPKLKSIHIGPQSRPTTAQKGSIHPAPIAGRLVEQVWTVWTLSRPCICLSPRAHMCRTHAPEAFVENVSGLWRVPPKPCV